MNKLLTALALVLIYGMGHPAVATEQTMTAEEFEAQLHYKQGKIELPGGRATLNVPGNFRYLGPEDANKILEIAWGNPPGSKTLGMLFPSDISPLSQDGWGVVIQYDHDGHISDEDAQEIDYDDLLENMQDETREASQQRVQQGYGSIDLVGWAEPPSYSASTHKMYWAKELKFGDSGENTLNYNIRVLGREGVLVLNAIAGMSQIGQIKQEMNDVLSFSNFNEGHRYEDFNASTDKVATYGLAALVGGAVAAKTGFFAKLVALLVAGKKFIIIGLLAIGGIIGKMFGRKSKEQV
ncbi:MAG: DUF2167 domain-containing protein [Gammaproteobacteria bacterium]